MTVNVTALPETGGAAAPVRTSQPVISAAGVNDAGALARQQLASAVPAPAFIPAYATHVANPPKPVIKPAASSALAAQLIGQNDSISAQELELFAPRAAPLTVAEYVAQGDDFLAAMRIARGEIEAPLPAASSAAKAVPQQAALQQATATATAQATAAAATESAMRTSLVPLTTSLPTVLTRFMRQMNIVQVRGVGAYQLAELRNAAMRKAAVAIQ